MAEVTDPEAVEEGVEGGGEEGGEVVNLNGANGNGESGSIEDRAAAGEAEEPEDDGTTQLVLPGSGGSLNTTVGGKRPTQSLFKMSGISLPVSGNVQVAKDETMWVAIEVAIDGVEVKNHRKGREIVAVDRIHKAVALGAPVILTEAPSGPPG